MTEPLNLSVTKQSLPLIIPDAAGALRLICMALPGRFAEAALEHLLIGGVVPAMLLLPAPAGVPPMELPPPLGTLSISLGPPPPAVRTLAASSGVPVYTFDSNGSQAASFLAALQPDAVLVCGWPRRINSALLAIPRYGFLNVHPSLLPDLRGPEPLFWAFRLGLEQSGVTIHRMDADFDTGPILAQAMLDLPAGLSGAAAERQAGALGAALILQTMRALQDGSATPQLQSAGRYLPAPGAADFRIAPTWSARHAFGFMRGTAEWQQPYPITIAGTDLLLTEALRYNHDAVQAQPLILEAAVAAIQCAPGVLYARYRLPT